MRQDSDILSADLESLPLFSFRREKKLTVLFFAFICFLLLFTMRGFPSSDGTYFIDQLETLVETGRLGTESPQSSWRTKKAADGLYYGTTNEMGMILTLLPFRAVGEFASGLTPPHMKTMVVGFSLALQSIFFTALSAWLVFALGREFGMRLTSALLGVLLFVVATPMFVYAGKLYREPLVVFAHLAVILAFLRFMTHNKLRQALWLMVWSLVLAVVRFQGVMAMVVVVCAVMLYNARKNRPTAKHAAAALGCVVVGCIVGYIALQIWQMLFAPGAKDAEAHVSEVVFSNVFRDVNGSEDFYDWAAALPSEEGWWVPLKRMFGMLFASGKGLFWYATASVIGVAVMLTKKWRVKSYAQIGLLFFFIYLCAYSLVSVWFSGAWGVRYLLPVLALPCLFAGDFLAMVYRAATRLKKGVLLLAIFLMCLTGIVGATVSDRPIISSAPSGVQHVTRYEQSWDVGYSPLYFHSKRFFSPNFSQIKLSEINMQSGEKELLDGYIVWWVLAYRLGVMPLLAVVVGISLGLFGLISMCLFLRELKKDSSVDQNSDTSTSSA